MVNCCVFMCPSRSERKEAGVTFHSFPKDIERRKLWVANTKIKDWEPTKNDRLCSKHFEDCYFYRTDLRVRLTFQAVPTIFSQLPQYLQPKKNSEVQCTIKNMSVQSQSTSTVLSLSLEETEPLTSIKNEPLESEIDIDDIPNSLEEEIIPDVKEIDIVWHELSEDLIKSETISENTFENNYSGSVETQVFVKTENIPLIKTENTTQSEYLHKTQAQDTRDGNVSRDTSQGVIEVQGSNEHFNVLQSDKQLIVNLFKDLSEISRKAKCPNKTVRTTPCKKDKNKGKVIEVPVIPIEPHKYTSLAKESTHKQNRKRYNCKKCLLRTVHYEKLKLHELTHKTEAKMDDRLLRYRCDKCKYKTHVGYRLKRHKLIHLQPEEIQYFYCYHCFYKSKYKSSIKNHIFRHSKTEDVPFHCYICNFVTLKRYLIIEHFKTHPEHHSKCDETEYIYRCKKCTYTNASSSNFKQHQLTHKTKAEIDDRLLKYHCDKCKYKTCWSTHFKRHKLIHLKPEEIYYFYCYHCSYKSKRKDSLQGHILRHFKNEDVPFHCYICDFTTLKRNLIIEHFKKHPKPYSKCNETDYKNQLEIYTKKQMRYCCEKCTYTSERFYSFKRHQLTHKTKAEIDDRLLKYHCDNCKYKTYWFNHFKAHKLIHLNPEEIHYFYCYHCSYKSNRKQYLKEHIFRHFKNEEIPFHCYICDFVTLKREFFKKHLKYHNNKRDETEYRNQLLRFYKIL